MAKKTTELAEVEVVDLAPVYEEAVEKVNGFIESSAKGLVDMGQYLLEEFFEGDVELAKSRDSNKGLSLRKLAACEDIDASYSTLSRAVDAAIVNASLSGVAALQQQKLSASHLISLINVEDEEQRVEYARRAVEEKLSSRKLKELLVEDGVVSPRGMAAVSTRWENRLRSGKMLGVYRAFGTLSESVERVEMDKLDKTSAKKALKEAETAEENLKTLIKKLKEKTQ
jgi:transcriptional regulator NrdR family protein